MSDIRERMLAILEDSPQVKAMKARLTKKGHDPVQTLRHATSSPAMKASASRIQQRQLSPRKQPTIQQGLAKLRGKRDIDRAYKARQK